MNPQESPVIVVNRTQGGSEPFRPLGEQHFKNGREVAERYLILKTLNLRKSLMLRSAPGMGGTRESNVPEDAEHFADEAEVTQGLRVYLIAGKVIERVVE